jgi:hypothetical protein
MLRGRSDAPILTSPSTQVQTLSAASPEAGLTPLPQRAVSPLDRPAAWRLPCIDFTPAACGAANVPTLWRLCERWSCVRSGTSEIHRERYQSAKDLSVTVGFASVTRAEQVELRDAPTVVGVRVDLLLHGEPAGAKSICL